MPANQDADGKLWIMPVVLELFAFPFAWISVQMLHDHESWEAITEYAVAGMALATTGVVWAVFRKKIAELWPWHQLRVVREKLTAALAENTDLKNQLNTLKESGAKSTLDANPAPESQLFTPLQLEAFSIARELRDLRDGMEPFPPDPPQNPGEDDADYLKRLPITRAERQGRWRLKLLHAYANRQFAQRITTLMHRAGEQLDFPIHIPDFAEHIEPSEDGIRKLAQYMDMFPIWINREQRDEPDLNS